MSRVFCETWGFFFPLCKSPQSTKWASPKFWRSMMAMVYRPSIDSKLAFVLMPFRHPFDDYYEDIIKPAAKAAGLETRKADEIYGTGPIIHDIWKQIWAAAVVIADVTSKNPNVNYELGICHALGVPTVIITQSFDDVPFDYQHRRCILYDTNGSAWQRDLKKSITATLKQVIAGEDVSPELGWPYDISPFRYGLDSGVLVPAADARDVVIRGAQMVRDAVAYAFGPHGKSVSARLAEDRHAYYKNGAAIAASLHASEPLEATGMDHAKQLAVEMRNSVGDGSKTAVLLFQRMVDVGNAALKLNHPLSDVLRGMERAKEVVISAIRGQSKPPASDSILHVARTASGGNPVIASIVVEAYKKAGRDGLIVIEKGDLTETTLEVQEGMHFDRGCLDAALFSPAEAQECVLQDAYILIYDFKISSMKDFLPLLEQIAAAGRPLLVVAEDVEGEALATIVVNRKKGSLDCIAVKAPGFGSNRRAMLQDIAVMTGGTAITESFDRRLSSVTLQDLGRARKVVVTKESTTILGGAGESNVGKYAEAIRDEVSRTKDPYTIERLRERLAKLSGGIAAIRIGGVNSQEVADRAYLAESAMHSVQKAIEEGIVAGGGTTLLQSKAPLAKLSFRRPGEVAGVKVLEDAMEEPFRQLVRNNGMDPEEVSKKLKRKKTVALGFDSETGELQDLASLGILDPVATVTQAVHLAFSHARTILETGAWDSTNPKVQKPARPSPSEGGAVEEPPF